MIGLMELNGIVGQAAVTITAVENKERQYKLTYVTWLTVVETR